MKSKLKISQAVIFLVLLLCSSLLAVESAPTTFENRQLLDTNLHVLPLEQSSTVGASLGSIESTDTSSNVSHSRSKRALIFRPLFVYRQQQIKKQRVR